VSNTIGEKSTPIRPHDSALSRHFCSPLSLKKVAALPRKGLPAIGFGWTMVRSTARSRLPSHAFNRMSAGRRPFPAMSTLRSCGSREILENTSPLKKHMTDDQKRTFEKRDSKLEVGRGSVTPSRCVTSKRTDLAEEPKPPHVVEENERTLGLLKNLHDMG